MFEITADGWTLKEKMADQRQVYVPKDTVVEYMRQVEIETNKRIKKYQNYAQMLKNKFKDYEGQSEKYYADVLEKFKKQAKYEIKYRQNDIDRLTKEKDEHEYKIARLMERIRARRLKGLLSDDEDEASDDDNWGDVDRDIDDEEYLRLKAERRRQKVEIKDWVRNFSETHKRLPTEEETEPIIEMIKEYNDVTAKFLDMKLTLIKQLKLPFDAYEFTSKQEADENEARRNTELKRRKSLQGRAQFLQQLKENGGTDPTANEEQQKELQYHEDQIAKLQQEIDFLTEALQSKSGTDKAIQGFVDQLQEKDGLLL